VNPPFDANREDVEMRPVRGSLVAVVVLVACTTTSTTVPASSPASSMPPSSAGPSGPAGGRWPTYHGDVTRSGVAAGPSLAGVRHAWTSPQLDGTVYAEPLAIGARVITATENDTVYALDAATGAVAWRRHLGTHLQEALPPAWALGTGHHGRLAVHHPEPAVTVEPAVPDIDGADLLTQHRLDGVTPQGAHTPHGDQLLLRHGESMPAWFVSGLDYQEVSIQSGSVRNALLNIVTNFDRVAPVGSMDRLARGNTEKDNRQYGLVDESGHLRKLIL